MKESRFQSHLKKRLRTLFPGCIILKNDPNDLQGFPDLTILYGEHWAVLECKREEEASRRNNQDYYVDLCADMSFGAFVYPENEEDVIDALQQAFHT